MGNGQNGMGNSRAQIPRRIDRIPGGTAKGESDRQYQEAYRKSGEGTQPESDLLAIQDNTLQQISLHTNKAGGGQIENSEDQNKCTDDFSDRIACIISYFRNCGDRKSTRLNSSHVASSYAVFCLKQTHT